MQYEDLEPVNEYHPLASDMLIDMHEIGVIADLDAAFTYVMAVGKALRGGAFVIPWLTSRCPDCGKVPADWKGEHVIIAGHVVIGCDGLRVISPEAVGIADPTWNDWSER